MATNPEGLVWKREPGFPWYRGDQARNYALELAADLANSPDLPAAVNYSTLPQDGLPFELRTTPPTFMEYIQAFYISVAGKADNEAEKKLKEIETANTQLKKLNELINLIGEVDARSPDDSDSRKVREAIVITARGRWPETNSQYVDVETPSGEKIRLGPFPSPTVSELAGDISLFVESKEFKRFDSEYRSGMSEIGLNASDDVYKVSQTTDGAGVARAVRNLQAESTARGNKLQSLMSEASTKINFQSAVNEGYKSFTDRWFQMLTQTSPRG